MDTGYFPGPCRSIYPDGTAFIAPSYYERRKYDTFFRETELYTIVHRPDCSRHLSREKYLAAYLFLHSICIAPLADHKLVGAERDAQVPGDPCAVGSWTVDHHVVVVFPFVAGQHVLQ